MRPIFTVHTGEYLVGSFIERNFKNINVWTPSKDTGIDLLLTNSKNTKTISIQVKFSKDWLSTSMGEVFQKGLKACGWWTLDREKITMSKANYWIFVLNKFYSVEMEFIIIKPNELVKIYNRLRRKQKRIQSYIWVTEKNKCWETRGLGKRDQILIANHSYMNKKRDLTPYLNNWKPIKNHLK
jgi:hypothetical protein